MQWHSKSSERGRGRVTTRPLYLTYGAMVPAMAGSVAAEASAHVKRQPGTSKLCYDVSHHRGVSWRDDPGQRVLPRSTSTEEGIHFLTSLPTTIKSSDRPKTATGCTRSSGHFTSTPISSRRPRARIPDRQFRPGCYRSMRHERLSGTVRENVLGELHGQRVCLCWGKAWQMPRSTWEEAGEVVRSSS